MTLSGESPLASTNDNLSTIGKPVTEVTEEDLKAAIRPLRLSTAVTVLRAAARWKKLGSRNSFSSLTTPSPSTPSPPIGADELAEGVGKLSTKEEDKKFAEAEEATGDAEIKTE